MACFPSDSMLRSFMILFTARIRSAQVIIGKMAAWTQKQNDSTRKHNQIKIQAPQKLIHPGHILSSQNQGKTLMNVIWLPGLVHPGHNQTCRTLPFHARTPQAIFSRIASASYSRTWSHRMVTLDILSTSRRKEMPKPSQFRRGALISSKCS